MVAKVILVNLSPFLDLIFFPETGHWYTCKSACSVITKARVSSPFKNVQCVKSCTFHVVSSFLSVKIRTAHETRQLMIAERVSSSEKFITVAPLLVAAV